MIIVGSAVLKIEVDFWADFSLVFVAMVKRSLYFLTTLFGCCVVLWIACWVTRPSLTDHAQLYTPQLIASAKLAGQIAFDPSKDTSVIVEQTVSPTAESPILAGLVKDGLLPPLKARMPSEPVVMKGIEGEGKYGGTWMCLSSSLADVWSVNFRLAGSYLMRWSTLGYPLRTFIAKSVIPSADRREWIVTLRAGMRWSDGFPYTADDILYWWKYEANDPLFASIPPPWMSSGGEFGRVEKIDTCHVRFIFNHPYPLFLEALARAEEPANTPEHYLRQFHPRIGDPSLIRRMQAFYELPSPRSVYDYLKEKANSECPRMWPWVYRRYAPSSPQMFVRNPYYYAVDQQGNQLPYIDRMQFQITDAKVLPISAANGGVTMQNRSIRYSDFTELMSRRGIAGTRVLQWYPGIRSIYVINPDLNRTVDPNDPSSAHKAKLLSDKRFRQALSLAINRKQIIRADYNDQCEPSQVEPGPLSPFHSEKLQHAFTQFDPAGANRLLDAIGLTHRDAEGFRTFVDGSRMSFFFDFTQYTGLGPAQFIADDWASVGVRIVLRERSRSLFYIEKDAGLFDFNVWTGATDFLPLLAPRYFVPTDTEAFYAAGWARWYMRGGFFGDPAALQKGCIPVPVENPMHDAMAAYVSAIQSVDIETQKQLMNKVFDIAAENLWSINIATSPPELVVVQDDLHNVPAVGLTGDAVAMPSNAGIETFFFGHPNNSPGAIQQARDSILHPIGRPGIGAKAGADQIVTNPWIRTVPALVLIIGIGCLGFRYRYIGRRLAIMGPTLIVISLVVFVIIKLPPGDYLSSRMAQLEESGDPQAQRQVEELRNLFHYNDPAWKQYTRWVGLTWFLTFHPEDAGLLQGNLGRSMATAAPVNRVIGERLLFTVFLSLGTILFTWAMALPIGIYSAVRQYSIGDYTLTLIGFFGMCVPPFLLAIVLMAMSGVSGLFTPEFAAQPEWNVAKAIDLMKHIWIPVVVLGAGGTAGMIRVMRANLLDELRRPYVITAVAKGVRPLKLLVKYPVRMSLNPFISGIGGLFPALISGGAIVSIVLSLPTIGPLMLDALRDQDMYLAGSLLVLLNALSVLGTLVSDLLLLWIDPRIRLGGGSR